MKKKLVLIEIWLWKMSHAVLCVKVSLTWNMRMCYHGECMDGYI